MFGIGIVMMVVYVYIKIYIDMGGLGFSIYRLQCFFGFCIFGDYVQEGDISKLNYGVMLCVFMIDFKVVVRVVGFN